MQYITLNVNYVALYFNLNFLNNNTLMKKLSTAQNATNINLLTQPTHLKKNVSNTNNWLIGSDVQGLFSGGNETGLKKNIVAKHKELANLNNL